jgi:hypothetical protein
MQLRDGCTWNINGAQHAVDIDDTGLFPLQW